MNNEWDEKYSITSREITNRLRNLSQVAQEATLTAVLALKIENPKVLEIGCGTGQHSVALASCSSKGEFVATDSSDSAIAETEALIRAADVHVKSCVADVTQLPFNDSEFDVVFGDHVIAHVPNIDLALRECFRVLKPGGFLVLNAANALRPDGWRLYVMLTHIPYLWRDFYPWKLRSLVTNVGFKVVKGYGSTIYLDRSVKKLFKRVSSIKIADGNLTNPTPRKETRLRLIKRRVFSIIERVMPPFLLIEYGVVARKV